MTNTYKEHLETIKSFEETIMSMTEMLENYKAMVEVGKAIEGISEAIENAQNAIGGLGKKEKVKPNPEYKRLGSGYLVPIKTIEINQFVRGETPPSPPVHLGGIVDDSKGAMISDKGKETITPLNVDDIAAGYAKSVVDAMNAIFSKKY